MFNGPWLICAAIGIGIAFYFLTRTLAALYFGKAPTGEAFHQSFDYVQASNDTWRTVAQIIGGAAFGLTFAWTVLQDQGKDARAAEHEANLMFIEGSKLLGSENASQRLAGIRTLKLVNGQWPDYATVVRDIFVSMIASGSDRTKLHDEKGLPFRRNEVVGLDVQAAIDSIGNPQQTFEHSQPLDLSGFYMVGGKFSDSSGFAGALFYNAKLFRTDFRNAHLEHTRFDGAALSDWEAYRGEDTPNEKGAWTDDTPYQWKNWERIRWIANFTRSHLEKATFTGTGLTGAWFFGADLRDVDFSRANLSRARFEGAQNLRSATFDQACYLPLPRDRPTFSPSDRVIFDAPVPHPNDGSIYIDKCK